MYLVCLNCNAEFVKRHYRQKFCSKQCMDASRTTRIERPCTLCGKLAIKHQSRKSKNFFCNQACHYEWQRQETLRMRGNTEPVRCFNCNNHITLLDAQPSKRRKRNFCDRNCRTQWQKTSGFMDMDANPQWRGGHNSYRGPNWRQQRKLAKIRDEQRCCDCGSTKNLQVHHIVPFATFENYEDANVLSNLKTLCRKCHAKAEWLWWKENPNTTRKTTNTDRIHVCRKCDKNYTAFGHSSLYCDACAPKGSRKIRNKQITDVIIELSNHHQGRVTVGAEYP